MTLMNDDNIQRSSTPLNQSCCLEVAVVALFCITKLSKDLEVDLTTVKKWKGFVELFLCDLYLVF